MSKFLEAAALAANEEAEQNGFFRGAAWAWHYLASVRDEAKSLRQEVAELRADAARWRYVRDCPKYVKDDDVTLVVWDGYDAIVVRGAEAVQAVDEAMKKTVA